MRVGTITNNNFRGKALFSKKLYTKEMQFAEEILNYEINGVSNKEFLAKRKFDIEFLRDNCIGLYRNKLKISSLIQYVITNGYMKGKTNTNYCPLKIDMNTDIEQGAETLRKHIMDTETFIEQNYPTHYYTKWQEIKMRLKVLLGKV